MFQNYIQIDPKLLLDNETRVEETESEQLISLLRNWTKNWCKKFYNLEVLCNNLVYDTGKHFHPSLIYPSRVGVRLKLNAQKHNLGRNIFIEFAIFIALVAKLNESNNTTSNIRHLCEIRTRTILNCHRCLIFRHIEDELVLATSGRTINPYS